MASLSSLARTTLLLPFEPRTAIRRIREETDPLVYALALFVVSAALSFPGQLLSRAYDPRLAQAPDWMNTNWALPLLGLAGLVATPLIALVLWGSSRALRGCANFRETLLAYVAGWVPGFFSSLLSAVVWFADVAHRQLGAPPGQSVGAVAFPVLHVLGYGFGLWTLIVTVVALAEVNEYGLGRAAGSLALAFLLFAILIGVAAAAWFLALR